MSSASVSLSPTESRSINSGVVDWFHFVESFQGRFRDECLNVELFHDLEDAWRKIQAWRRDYNTRRPHSALGNIPPREYHRRWQSERDQKKRIS